MIPGLDPAWMKYMGNPRLYTTRQYMANMLKDRFPHYEGVVERIANGFQTDKDMDEFVQMQVSLFESGYLKAVNDYRKQLEEAGLKVTVTPAKT